MERICFLFSLTLTIINLQLTQLTLQSRVSTYFIYVFTLDCLGGYRERETPGPIPNPEAKPLIADNTAPFRCGNVGRCLVDQFLHILPSLLLSLLLYRPYFYS